MTHIILRRETYPDEQRTPLTPQDAQELMASGAKVSIESWSDRIIADSQYAAIPGIEIIEPDAWHNLRATDDLYILGLKALDPSFPHHHNQIYFAHAYKQQSDAAEILSRFQNHGGCILDLEFLTDQDGRRVVAFGYWAGYVGACLAVWQYARQHTQNRDLKDLSVCDQAQMLAAISSELKAIEIQDTRIGIIGHLGRCGRGAQDALKDLGFEQHHITGWDQAETKALSHDALRQDIRQHHIIVNTVFVQAAIPPFITQDDLHETDCHLEVITDVSCDVTSPFNPLPIYSEITSWQNPVLQLANKRTQLIAIDNLPSMLPKEASEDFSAQLLPYLKQLATKGIMPQSPWQNALDCFDDALKQCGISAIK